MIDWNDIKNNKMTEEYEAYMTLIDECFSVSDNGGMKDLMNEWQGEHNRNEADELVEALANELYSFNEGRFGSVTLHDFTMADARNAARDEFIRRAHLSWEDENLFTLKAYDDVDEVREAHKTSCPWM